MKKNLIALIVAICLTLTPITCFAGKNEPKDIEDMSVKEIKALDAAVDAVLNGDSVDDEYAYLEDMSVKEIKELNSNIDELLGNETKETETETIEENEEAGGWVIKYYVDEFKEPTDEGYVTNDPVLEGTFSNSATSNSLLRGFFLVDDESVALKLYEYDQYKVTNPYNKLIEYRISVLDQDKNKKSFYGAIDSNGDRIFIYDNTNFTSCKNFVNLLKKKGTIKISIDDYGSTSYLIPVNCNGFEEAYSELFGK